MGRFGRSRIRPQSRFPPGPNQNRRNVTDASESTVPAAPATKSGRVVAVVVGALAIVAALIAAVVLSKGQGERARNDDGSARANARTPSERTNTANGSTANDALNNGAQTQAAATNGASENDAGDPITPPPVDPTLAELGLVPAAADDPRVQAILERFRFGEWAALAELLEGASFDALSGALLASPTVGQGATQLQRLLLAELSGDLAAALRAGEGAPIDPAMVARAHAELLTAFLVDGESGATRMPGPDAQTWPPGTAAMWRETRLLLSLTLSAGRDPASEALFLATLTTVLASPATTDTSAHELRALQAELLDVFTIAGVAPIDTDGRKQLAAALSTIPGLSSDGPVTEQVASLRAALLDLLATTAPIDTATREAELVLARGFATNRRLDLVDREAAARLLASGPVDANAVNAVATLVGALASGRADATVAAQALQTLTACALDRGLAQATPEELAACATALSRLLVDTAADPNAAGPLRVEAMALVAEVAIAAKFPQGDRDFAALSPTTMSELIALSERAIATSVGQPGYDPAVRQQAVFNLATLGELDETVYARVQDLARSTATAPDLAVAAMQCLDIAYDDDREIIHAGLAPTRPRAVRVAACGQLRGDDQFDRAARLARDDADPELRLAAVNALARCTSTVNREQALELALSLSRSDSSPAVRNAAGALANRISRELER